MICYGQVKFVDHFQEHYETASRDAGRRAKDLRRAGMKVNVSSSMQVTSVGLIKMTMLTAYTPNGEG